METSVIINVAATLISLGALYANIKSAKEAKRSANAAEEQTNIQREQWEAEKTQKSIESRPEIKFQVVESEQSSYLVLLNQGSQTANIKDVLLNGESIQFSKIAVTNDVPKPSYILPAEASATIFRGIGEFAFSSTAWRHAGEKTLQVQFSYGSTGNTFIWECKVAIGSGGLIVVKDSHLIQT